MAVGRTNAKGRQVLDNTHNIYLISDLHAAMITDMDIYSHLKSSLLLSPHLPGKFKNRPHCLTFKYKVDLPTCKLTVVTFSNIGGSFVDNKVIWTSQLVNYSTWTTAHVDILEGYFDRFATEAVIDQGKSDNCSLAFDDVTVYNGYCV